MRTVLPNTFLFDIPIPGRRTLEGKCTSYLTPTVSHDTHTPEPPSEKDSPKATPFRTNVVVLPRSIPTAADRNRAAEAFALSLECAAVGDIAGEEAALRAALDTVPDDSAANINYGNRMYHSGRFQEALAVTTPQWAPLPLTWSRSSIGETCSKELGFYPEAIAGCTTALAFGAGLWRCAFQSGASAVP